MPREVSATEAKNRLGALLAWVQENQDEVIIESHGKPAAVVIPVEQYDRLKAQKEQERRDKAIQTLRQIRAESLERNKDLTPEEGEALAERFSQDIVEALARKGKIRFEDQ